MKAEWVKVGKPERPYAEIVVDDSGMVYISVQSGAVRTSDYLTVEEAARLGRALLLAAYRAKKG